LPVSFHAQARKPQFKAQPDPLLHSGRCDRLKRYAFVVQVADNAAIGLIKSDVGQGAKFMPVVAAWLPRGKCCKLHILRQESLGRKPFLKFYSDRCGLTVSWLVLDVKVNFVRQLTCMQVSVRDQG
jgi:hypothetical protein